MYPFIIISVLAVATVFAFIHAHTKRIARRERAVSNLRVLREYKRMTIHNPEKIIDPRRSRDY